MSLVYHDEFRELAKGLACARSVESRSARRGKTHSARQRRREAQAHSNGDRGNERAAEPVAPGKMRVRNDCPRKIKDSGPCARAVVSAKTSAVEGRLVTLRGDARVRSNLFVPREAVRALAPVSGNPRVNA